MIVLPHGSSVALRATPHAAWARVPICAGSATYKQCTLQQGKWQCGNPTPTPPAPPAPPMQPPPPTLCTQQNKGNCDCAQFNQGTSRTVARLTPGTSTALSAAWPHTQESSQRPHLPRAQPHRAVSTAPPRLAASPGLTAATSASTRTGRSRALPFAAQSESPRGWAPTVL